METHVDETGGLTHEFTGDRDEQVGVVASFVLLHLGGLSDHLGGGVVHIRFIDNGVSVGGNEKLFEVVDDHLVHA